MEGSPFSYEKASDSSGFLLWQVHNQWQREIKKCLKKFDLTHTQFVVLANAYWLILHQESVVNQVDIANHANTDVMMTSNVLRTLEKKAYINRRDDKVDTRSKVITLTEKGISILEPAIKEVEHFDRCYFSKINDLSNFNHNLLTLLNQ